jgi:hypothetical protein
VSGDKKKAAPTRQGFATHHVKNTSGNNSHAAAAENRAMRRVRAYTAASTITARLKKQGSQSRVISCYPSSWEESKIKEVPYFDGFRDVYLLRDEVRVLQKDFRPIPQGVVPILVLNDVPMADLGKLYRRFQSHRKGVVTIVWAGLSYGGRMGFDSLSVQHGEKPSTFWYKADGNVYTNAIGCVTQYVDQMEHPWLDKQSGLLEEGVYFMHQPLSLQGRAGFVSTITLTNRPQPEIPLGFPLSARGVLIDNDGFIPLIDDHRWFENYGSTPGAQASIRRTADREIEDFHGLDLREWPKLRRDIQEARTRTIERSIRRKPDPIPIPATRPGAEALYEASKERYSNLPAGGIIAALTTKATIPDAANRAWDEFEKSSFHETILALIEKFKEAMRKFISFFTREEQVSGDSDESFEDGPWERDGPQFIPLNVVFGIGRAAGKLSRFLAPKTSKFAAKLSSGLGRVSNVLQKPFRPPTEDATLGELVSQCIALLLSAAVERVVARIHPVCAAFIAVIDAVLACVNEDVPLTKVIAPVSILLGHLFLSLAPLWLSLPIHVLLDFWALWGFEKIGAMVPHIVEFMGGAGKKLAAAWEKIRRIFDFQVDGGNVTNFQDEVVCAGENPRATEWLVDGPIPHVAIDGEDISATDPRDLSQDPYHVAIPLIEGLGLDNVALTSGDSSTLTNALATRYANIEKAPPTAAPAATLAWELLLRDLKPYIPLYRALEWEEFEQHMQEQGFSKVKKLAFKKAYENWQQENPLMTKTLFGGKSRELLKVREDGSVKTRIVHLLPPECHVPDILEAGGLKRFFALVMPNLTILKDKWRIKFFRPQKGTSTEMSAAMSDITRDDILVSFSGDDGHLIIHVRGLFTIAVDLKSCDTTIQTPLLKVIHSAFRTIGVSKSTLDRIEYYNSSTKVCDIRTPDGVTRVTYENQYGMNSSGTCLTTLTTDLAYLLLWYHVFSAWDGDLNRLKPQIVKSMSEFGLKPEFEEDHSTLDNGLTPIGVQTFLSMVPYVPTHGPKRVSVLKASYTKSLLVKGRSQQDKGFTIDFGVATRALDPILSSSPYGKAIRSALHNHVLTHPATEAVPVISPYAIQFDSETVSEFDEFTYLARRIPGLSESEYQLEMDAWREVSSFPFRAAPGTFRIFDALSGIHYGYLPGDESQRDALGQGVT